MRGAPLVLLFLLAVAAAAPAPAGPPAGAVRWVAGADAAQAQARGLVSTYAIAPDGRSFTLGVAAVAGARVTIDELLRLVNDDASAPHDITFAAPSSARASWATTEQLVLVDAAGARLATLDLARGGSVAHATLPAGGIARVALVVEAPEAAAGVPLTQTIELS